MSHRAVINRPRRALVALGLLAGAAFPLIGPGSNGPAHAVNSCGYVAVSVPSVTSTSVPVTTYCNAPCPWDADFHEGPHDIGGDQHVTVGWDICVTGM